MENSMKNECAKLCVQNDYQDKVKHHVIKEKRPEKIT